MKYFLVDIVWNDPYPKQYHYRIEAGSLPLGVKRGLQKMRNENKGRRIKDLLIKVKEYGTGIKPNLELSGLQGL